MNIISFSHVDTLEKTLKVYFHILCIHLRSKL